MAKLTKKSLETKQTLLRSAEQLFSAKWYETVSVPEISRHAGKSSGAFYNYFKNKEEIFLSLLNRFLEIFQGELEKISGGTLEERMESFIDITIGTAETYRDLVTIFREGQYRYNEMEQRLKAIYVDALTKVYGRELTENEYLYITGPVRFISIRSLYHKRPYDRNSLMELLLRGMYGGMSIDRDKVFGPVSFDDETAPENTRDILLAKAVELFGEEGFHQVNVYDITRQSRFAVGTFYRHFESKEQILEELVEMIGKKTRSVIAGSMENDLNPLEQTIRGFYAFIRMFEKHPAYYKIVREAEFVIDKTVEDYYNRFEKGYLKQQYPEKMDPVTMANALSGIGHYFGIEDIFSHNIDNIESGLLRVGSFLQSGIRE
ncbi:TetR/AcrR family transcriptional regulator [Spirochaeta isovalerica]|uniref:AcrR family transcriptional regulator n=1 Tax=Spirochaeta isovalerica TaxID=150 RepID=A0A841RH67_9SPIO|nr:TetR/AcrR family transcriptional regulator [Spirochaeta isovalerica]MBB6482537.1 AcrR family transcriptional regulator [Spirochaeta isovalerica]